MGKKKASSPKKTPTCQCAQSKASTNLVALECGNCTRKMAPAKWKRIKAAEDKKFQEQVALNAKKSPKEPVVGEETGETAGEQGEKGKGETPGGEGDVEEDSEQTEHEEEKKEVGKSKAKEKKKEAKRASRGKAELEEEDEAPPELTEDAGADDGLVMIFCSVIVCLSVWMCLFESVVCDRQRCYLLWHRCP